MFFFSGSVLASFRKHRRELRLVAVEETLVAERQGWFACRAMKGAVQPWGRCLLVQRVDNIPNARFEMVLEIAILRVFCHLIEGVKYDTAAAEPFEVEVGPALKWFNICSFLQAGFCKASQLLPCV